MSWPIRSLGDLVDEITAGRSFGASNAPAAEDEWGIIKVSAMTSGEFKPEENKAVPANLVDPRFEIREGDLLLSRANTSDHVGASVLVGPVRPRLLLSDKSLRLKCSSSVQPKWLWYALQASESRRQIRQLATGTKDSMRNISQEALRTITLPVPPGEVQRLVTSLLDGHMSRLDAADDYLDAGRRRLDALVTSLLLSLIPDVSQYPARWETSTVGEAGLVELGRQRHPDWHSGTNMRPYLRVANVFEDRICGADIKEMHWPQATFERFKLRIGDILLNEGQTPDLLGRPAIYRGDPSEVAFTNSLLRFVAGDSVLPEFALLVFRRHMRAGRFKRESRITTNIAHLSASRLKPIEFPIPSLDEQAQIAQEAEDRLGEIKRLRAALDAAMLRSRQLRRIALSAALTGGLKPAGGQSDRILEDA